MGMIVPIQGKTEKECLDILKKLREDQYFPYLYAVELRYDFLEKRVEKLADFLQGVRNLIGEKKLIFTIRTNRQGGFYPFGKSYFQENILAMESGIPDYIDLEVECGISGRESWKECIAMVKRLGGKVIASYHDFHRTPDLKECEAILERLSSYSPDIVKMAFMPKKQEDVLNLLFAGRRWRDKYPKKELITISMGEMGKLSRLCGDLSGSSHSFVQIFGESAPGQWKIEEYLKLHRALSGRKGIALLGFMGSGKSTLAGQLAVMGDLPYFETDAVLEQEFSMSIKEYFQKFGEESFRREESRVLKKMSGREMILSPGGGIVLKEENRNFLKNYFFCVYLKVSPETVLQRLSGTKNLRPLLQDKMNLTDITEMMERRSAFYEETADYILEGDGKSISECLTELQSVLLENAFFPAQV